MKHLSLDVHKSAVLKRKLDALLNDVCARETCSRSPPKTKGIIVSPAPPLSPTTSIPSGWSQCSSNGSAPLGPHLFAFLGSVKIMHVIRRKCLLSLPVGNGARWTIIPY